MGHHLNPAHGRAMAHSNHLIMYKEIRSFKSPHYNFLSNFYPVMISMNGLHFPSVEHAYQASKFNDIKAKIRIQQSRKPKSEIRNMFGYAMTANWDQHRLGIMRRLLEQKFCAGSVLAERLEKTGDAHIVEGNNWHDNFWGDCFCDKCLFVVGKNHLGKMLEEVRAQNRVYMSQEPKEENTER